MFCKTVMMMRRFRFIMDRALAEPGEIYPAPQTIDDLKDFPFLKRRVTFH
jgi:hypothetical protein